ncbi:MAG TPA: inositol monophosphatase [Planctomycetaceae bacterium]|nr:inositol monophosphatase [Planctomycetaceae bacterium]
MATTALNLNVHSPLQAACDAAKTGGRILLEQLGKAAVREKAPADLVTDADVASQNAIRQILTSRYPQFAFMGEESTPTEQTAAQESGRPIWVVDPLDGTANYVHRLPGFSVSIALVERDQVRLGVVYDPLSGVLYWAGEDGPAMKDGKPIRSSGCTEISRAMACCSFTPNVHRNDPTVEQFLRVLERCQSLRRLGSAALNLCFLAEGCLDTYWASSVKVWDVAAGYLIASRAGVVYSHENGSDFDLWKPVFLASATGPLQQQMIECVKV